MPLFFLLPLWLLCILGAIITLFFRNYRYLATHLALCSTGALIGGCILSFIAIVALGALHLQGSTAAGILALVLLLGSGTLGGILGFVAGFLVARSINRAVGW